MYGSESFHFVFNIKSENIKILEIKNLCCEMVFCKVGLHVSSYTQNIKEKNTIDKFLQTRNHVFDEKELNDFICVSLQNFKFNENEMEKFIGFMQNIKNYNDTQIEFLKNKLSYVKISHLGYFCYLISNFISSIEFKERLLNNYQKRGYYYTFFVDFLNILDNQTILDLAQSHFNINLKDSNAIKIDKICQNEKLSHYIQGAYLKRIIGEKMKFFNADKSIIKGVKVADLENPYCMLYIYGTTINEEKNKSIENKLAEGIEYYFNDFLNHIQNVDIRNNYSYKLGNKIKLYQELNLYFILNYVRTPAFLDDLFLSFNLFLSNKGNNMFKKTEEKNINFFAKSLIETLNPFENQIVFKKLQLVIIELILDNIQNNKFPKPIEILNEIKNYTKKSQYLYDFIMSVINKLYSFLNTCWDYKILDKELKFFGDSLFILKSGLNKELFENSDNISLAFFPINKDKIIFFTNNKQSSKENFNQIINKEHIMLSNKRNKFIVEVV